MRHHHHPILTIAIWFKRHPARAQANMCPTCPKTLSETSGTKRKLNRTSGSTTCDVQRPYVEVECVEEVPYDAGSEADVWQSWINESIMEHNKLMADPAAPAADDAIMKWESFREDFQGLDGKLQVLHGLRVYFSKRLAHEVWESGHRKTWKMDHEWNNETRSLFEMFWNQREKKVWMK